MTFEELGPTLERIEDKLNRLLDEPLTLEEVCRIYLGRSREWARQRPWSLPPQDDANPFRWRRAVCDEYYSVPLRIREEQYLRERRSA